MALTAQQRTQTLTELISAIGNADQIALLGGVDQATLVSKLIAAIGTNLDDDVALVLATKAKRATDQLDMLQSAIAVTQQTITDATVA